MNISLIDEIQMITRTEIMKSKHISLFNRNSSVAGLVKLDMIDLTGNSITGLPDYFFTAIPSLAKLFLGNNRIDDDLIGVQCSYRKV